MKRTTDTPTAWTFFGVVVVFLLVTSPIWLVLAAGLFLPFLIAAFIVVLPISAVYRAVKK